MLRASKPFSIAIMTFNILYLITVLVAPVLANYSSFLLRTPSEEEHLSYQEEDVGTKLILTSYINAGNIADARNLSKVTGEQFPDDIPSYSGFLTVNSSHDSNLFFWFFPAEHGYENAPVLLWLQGGPGASSMYSLFNENGPYSVSEDGNSLIRNPYSWHKNHSIIYIDQPVGTGFSYTKDNEGYLTNEVDIGENLYIGLLQFFTMFPEFQKNDFFITGESYAGKYIPALGHTIHIKNPKASLKINLKGLVIGNGLVDPLNMLRYSDMVYQWGLVDRNRWSQMQAYENLAAKYIAEEDYEMAQVTWNNDLATFQYMASVSVYNILEDSSGINSGYTRFLQKENVRKAIHVGSQSYSSQSNTVYSYLIKDIMKSVRPWVEQLLDSGYKVVFYNGQLDIICGYSLTLKMVEALQYNAAEQYKTASRLTWYVNGKLAGYTKTAGNMTEVLVRNAGHMVPGDQPAAAFDLLYKITRNEL